MESTPKDKNLKKEKIAPLFLSTIYFGHVVESDRSVNEMHLHLLKTLTGDVAQL